MLKISKLLTDNEIGHQKYLCIFCTFVILQESTDSDAPLDGAKARLEVLRESLYKREREISMLIDGGGFQNGVAPSAYTRLLAAVVRQVGW